MSVRDYTKIPEIDAINTKILLEVYLGEKPINWARQIALRAGLRVLPVLLVPSKNDDKFLRTVLQSWRALIISLFLADNRHGELGSMAAKTFRSNKSKINAVPFHTAAAFAISTAQEAVATASVPSSLSAAALAAKAVASAANAAVTASTWPEVRYDIYNLVERGSALRKELFNTEEFPDSNVRKLGYFIRLAGKENINFEIVSKWYQTIVNSNASMTPWGKVGSNLDLELVNKDNEFWNRDPHVVIDDIAEIVGWNENVPEEKNDIDDGIAETISNIEFSPLGYSFTKDETHFKLAINIEPSDQEAIENPQFQMLLEDLKVHAEDFKNAASRLANQRGWERVGRTTERLVENLSGDNEHLNSHSRQIWSDLSNLTSCWERDKKISGHASSSLVDPLEPETLHMLEQVIMIGNPWIREIPSIRKLDEESQKFRGHHNEYENSTQIVEEAYQQGVIEEGTYAALKSQAEIAERGGSQAPKAQAAATGSSLNLIRSAIKLVSVSVFAGGVVFAATEYGLYKVSFDFLISSWPTIELLFKAHTAELAAYFILIKRLKQLLIK